MKSIKPNFVRIVVAPTMRMLNSTVGSTRYIRIYLPILLEGEAPKRSQSVTFTGESISKTDETVTGIKVEVDFPLAGFDNVFFNFPTTEESISLAEETILELYVGGVDVALGAHT